MGHHPVPRTHAKALGMPDLGTKYDSPSWFPNEIEGSADLHKEIHQSLKDGGVPFNRKFDGTQEELIEKIKDAYDSFTEKGTLKIPSTDDIIAENITLSEAVDKSIEWNDCN